MAIPATAFRLAIELGERTERRPLASGVHVVGSAADCEVTVSHPSVSRRHARLEVGAGGVTLVELGSRNGTWVDGRRVEGVVALPPGCLADLAPSVRTLLDARPAARYA